MLSYFFLMFTYLSKKNKNTYSNKNIHDWIKINKLWIIEKLNVTIQLRQVVIYKDHC